MKAMLRRLATLAVPVLAISLALGACGDDGSSNVDENHDLEPTQVEGDEHEEAEENAHLEVAPKDALFLMEMTSFAFAPDVFEVSVGDVVEIAIQNVEPVVHDFTIDEIDADVHISYLGGTGQHEHQDPEIEADVHFALTEAGSGIVHLEINEPGEFAFYCSVPGHREAGMEGTLIVQ